MTEPNPDWPDHVPNYLPKILDLLRDETWVSETWVTAEVETWRTLVQNVADELELGVDRHAIITQLREALRKEST